MTEVTDIDILYEDEWLLAADKPAGLLVHGDGTGALSLTGLVRAHLVAAGEDEAAAQLQAVQRLDVDTTGIVLFSKDKAIQPALDALVAAHGGGAPAAAMSVRDSAPVVRAGVRKRYLAIVRGAWPWESCEIDAAIGRDRHDARRMRVAALGKPARTYVMRLATTGSRSGCRTLLLVELASGRKHQIRVHLASRGFPIVGDALYGTPADRRRRASSGLMLHAVAEDLVHPVTRCLLALRAPIPARFTEVFPDADALFEGAVRSAL